MPVRLCSFTFPIMIRLQVSNGTETLTAVKELNLMTLGEAPPNQNPTLGEVRVTVDDSFDRIRDSSATDHREAWGGSYT
jgi:hypothetical protein